MRMIAIAQAWRDRGGAVTLAACECPDALRTRLMDDGVGFVEIAAFRPGGLEDQQRTTKLAKDLNCVWVILDGYQFYSDFHHCLRTAGMKVLAVDDYGHNESWAADAILNQNLFASAIAHKVDIDNCHLLLGIRFALLRREFTSRPPVTNEKRPPLRKLLVSLGGGDPENATGKILQLLNGIDESNLEIRILVGSANPHLADLKVAVLHCKHQIEILTDVRDMPSLYQWADGVISAGGSTCLEWLYFQLPAVVIVIAENQRMVAKVLEQRRLSINLGWHQTIQSETATNQLREWLNAVPSQGEKKQKLVDGQGAQRVTAFIDSGIWLRPATLEDCRLYFEWVNEREVRLRSIRNHKITWEEHCQWFQQRLQSDSARLLIAMEADTPVGQIRTESYSSGDWEIDFSVAACERGKGHGIKILRLAIERMRREAPIRLIAVVKHDNYASIRCFEKLGFTVEPKSPGGLMRFTLGVSCAT